jgi:hypothetical protein
MTNAKQEAYMIVGYMTVFGLLAVFLVLFGLLAGKYTLELVSEMGLRKFWTGVLMALAGGAVTGLIIYDEQR